MEFTIYNEFSEALKQEWNDLLAQSTPHVPFLRLRVFACLVAAPRRRGMAAGRQIEPDHRA